VDTLQSPRVRAFLEAINSVHPLALKEPKVLAYQQSMLALLTKSTDKTLSRSRPNAHFTVSAFIFSRSGDCLALFHRKLQRWLQPGGHVEESDLTPLDGAIREAREESGLIDLSPLSVHPVDLDIHSIPERRKEAAHEHYDLRYALVTDAPHKAHLSDESSGIKWLQRAPLDQWRLSSASIDRPIKIGLTLLV
jgi:8-oxo-dGTP pyrophosphatase MutT (NUDIX family)